MRSSHPTASMLSQQYAILHTSDMRDRIYNFSVTINEVDLRIYNFHTIIIWYNYYINPSQLFHTIA